MLAGSSIGGRKEKTERRCIIISTIEGLESGIPAGQQGGKEDSRGSIYSTETDGNANYAGRK
jgi:hypothetical protein